MNTFDFSPYLDKYPDFFTGEKPWTLVKNILSILEKEIEELDKAEYEILAGNVFVHKTATIEPNVTLKGPIIIEADCFVGSNCYLRGGVYLAKGVKLGPTCEIKTSYILENTSIAHMNFIGDSIIGSGVNFEGGSLTANFFNERQDKTIKVLIAGEVCVIESTKFGALVGDGSRIGANAVTSPGTILEKNSVVARLELVDQCKGL
jgi:NDP-sugar pyrophosphorylase family protein